MRFEKAQDPRNTVRGLARALELLEEVSPGIRLVGGQWTSGSGASAEPIELSMEWLVRKLGSRSGGTRRAILESLEFGVSPSRGCSRFRPSWRATRTSQRTMPGESVAWWATTRCRRWRTAAVERPWVNRER
jgi:phenylalanyl-tRNA synthetase beta chain